MSDIPIWLTLSAFVLGGLVSFALLAMWRRRSIMQVLQKVILIPKTVERGVRYLIVSYWAICVIITVIIFMALFRYSVVASSDRAFLLDRWTGTVYIVVYPKPYQTDQQ